MSKLELLNKPIKNAKIDQLQLKKICYYFAYDFTASQTAQELSLSRQTINSYYKKIRESLIIDFDSLNTILLSKQLNKQSFELKYIKLKSDTIYYIELDNKAYLIDSSNLYLKGINSFINNNLKDSLINHKRANCAKVLFNSYQKEFFIANYSKSPNNLNEFINNRIKKFRGLNKNNVDIHIKESIIRYESTNTILFTILKRIFSL